MGKKIERTRSKTLPSSPTHSFSSSSSSSDFEFRISISPRKSSAALCPADELFYKGKILPLHTSPRISMVRTLLLASSSTSSSSDTATTTASRDSSSSNDSTSSSFAADLSLLAATHPFPDSNRPSSATDDDHIPNPSKGRKPNTHPTLLSRFSSVFKKDNHSNISQQQPASSSNAKRVNSTAKDVIRKYLKKVKPLYDKLSSKHGHVRSPCVGGMSPVLETTSSSAPLRTTSSDILLKGTERSTGLLAESSGGPSSFSGNLKCPKMLKRGYVASCPSSMRSSPNHSGVLTRTGMPARHGGGAGAGASTSHGKGSYSSDASTMEELQNAIQGAIAHCKSSMLQTTTSSFNNNNNLNFLNNNNNNNNNNNISNKKCKALEI